ncbi:MAG: methionine biosynthesis PLP-dependent protein, partial [Fibrobacteres bacterium]|nr:methionine biosynthesis PLP-dependent protein [Fibrobacterota bacterium]
MKINTRLAQAGNNSDSSTGAVSTPVYFSATFSRKGLGEGGAFD